MDRNSQDSSAQTPAAVNQPKLKVLGDPIVTQITFSDSCLNKFNKMQDYDSILDTFNVKENTLLKITTKLEVTNIGSSPGALLLYITTDTLAEINDLRGFLSGNQNDLELKYQINFFPPELENELLPFGRDSLDLDLVHTVQFKSDKNFTLHYLLIYEDDDGNIFDTYFETAYKFKNTVNPQIFSFKDRDLFDKEFLGSILSLTIHENDLTYLNHSEPIYHSYQKEKSKYIRKLINDMYEKLSYSIQ